MSGGVWVFGYGSLASPASLGRTIRRAEVFESYRVAHLDGYGRRWNYGSLILRGDWHHDGVEVRSGVVVSLGLESGDDQTCNGMVFRVALDDLELLDRREGDYQRTDVTERVRVDGDAITEQVVTYVPRASAIERYEQARDEQRGAVRREYWDLVHDAFAEMGPRHLDQMAETPRPDVPVLDVTLVRRP